LKRTLERSERTPNCFAVYLHVISYNTAAMRFYEKLGFERVRKILDFYDICGRKFDCYIYARPTRAGKLCRPQATKISRAAKASAQRRRTYDVAAAAAADTRGQTTTQEEDDGWCVVQ